jgi:hypothetical protein
MTTKVRPPYLLFKIYFIEVDLIYFDGHLIVAAKNNFKCLPINPQEISTTISQYYERDD